MRGYGVCAKAAFGGARKTVVYRGTLASGRLGKGVRCILEKADLDGGGIAGSERYFFRAYEAMREAFRRGLIRVKRRTAVKKV